MSDLIIRGNQAYTAAEWAMHERRREQKRAKQRERYRTDPEYRAKVLAATRRSKAKRRAERPARLAAKIAGFERAWASLHSLSCPYPEKGCACRVILLVKP